MATPSSTTDTLRPGRNTIRLVYRLANPQTKTEEDKILDLPMPEDINFGVASSWESFSEGSLVDFIKDAASIAPTGITGSTIRTGAKANELYTRATNNNTFISSFSHQTWRGTRPIEFNLKVILTAFTSAKEEVMDTLEALLHLSLPEGRSSASNFVESTVTSGLQVAGINDAQFIKSPPRDISLYIGTNLAFPAIIIPAVTVSFPTRMDTNGDFIFAEADVIIRTSYTPIANMFKFRSFQSDAERQAQQLWATENNPN